MSKRDRPDISKRDYALLINEVDSLCPICSEPLIFFKNSKSSNLSQAAHIYPHSPSADEEVLLANVPRLSTNVDDIENLIMLCPTCHVKFDHPRTVEEYLVLYDLKRKLLLQQKAREYYKSHDIESDICDVFTRLSKELESEHNTKLSYNAKKLNDKLTGCSSSLPNIIRRDVRDYYFPIKSILFEVEKEHPGITESFAIQVKSLYLQYTRINLPKNQIYESINEWLNKKTKNKYQLIIPFLTAFYIQNCEVF